MESVFIMFVAKEPPGAVSIYMLDLTNTELVGSMGLGKQKNWVEEQESGKGIKHIL
jgi:hypothetical protein